MRVLFVCTGNICRSPTAEGVARKMAADMGLEIDFDSAGTHGYHVGDAPDRRSTAMAASRGYDLSRLRARQVTPADFNVFDLILAMDEQNLRALLTVSPSRHHRKIRRLLDYAEAVSVRNVPDPYYGGMDGFEEVLSLVENGVKGLLSDLERK